MGRYNIHICGQSHIDVAWLWRYDPETIHDCCKLTFTRAIDNLRLDKDYVYIQSQAVLYETVEKHFPEIFAEIAKYVREGRWVIVGGMYVEPDCGIPCGESLIRQCLFGQRYFKSKFGVTCRIGWLPDTWIHNWQMPQILKKCGMDYFCFSRGAKGEEIFWWEAPDGSRVLAYRLRWGKFKVDPRPTYGKPDPDLKEFILEVFRRYGLKDAMMIIGAGDHGGGPTYQEIQNVKKVASDLEPEIQVKFSRPDGFFDKIVKEADDLPVLKDELDFELVGDLTNCARIKKRNRLAENLLLSTEKFSLIASKLSGFEYPEKQLNRAWRNILFNQFHDIIGGSVIPEAERDAHILYDETFDIGNDLLRKALESIMSKVCMDGDEMAIIVFNSLSWVRSDVVDVELKVPSSWKSINIIDPEGKPVPLQIIKHGRNGKLRVLFEAEDVPSLGYKIFRVTRGEVPIGHEGELRAEKDLLENRFYRVSINEIGLVDSIIDKKNGRELIAGSLGGNLLQLIEDMGDSEGRLIRYTSDGRIFNRSNVFVGKAWNITSKPTVRVIENGPVRARVRITRSFKTSRYTQEVILYSRLDRVDFNLRVDWHEIHSALKVGFPFNISDPTFTYEIPFGAVTRPISDEERPLQRWIDVSESDGSYGVTFLNDSKYGCDYRDGMVRLTILRSPTWPAFNTDEGLHEIGYSLHPHIGDWIRGDAVRKGYEFNYPLIPYVKSISKVEMPFSFSFIQAEPENLIVTAVKKAEDTEDVILRLYETAGKRADARITLNLYRGISSAVKTNFLEETVLEEIEVSGDTVNFNVNPHEISSIKISLK